MKRKDLFSKSKNVTFNLIEVIVIVLITGLVVSVGSGLIIYNNYDNNKDSNKIDKSEELKEFAEVYNNIINSYVEEVNKKELIESAIEGMFNYLGDGYSNYFDSESSSDLQDRLNGEYYGIGIEINNNKEGKVQIVNIFENTPAEKAGLKVGDIILKIDEESSEGKTAAYVATLIKNSSKSEISLQYQRDGVQNTINIKLMTITIPIVTTETYDKTGYINISSFSANSLEQIKSALTELENKGINSLIIDVRNNSGGYLKSASEIADLFIAKGLPIYQLKKKNNKIEIFKAKDDFVRHYKIVVLQNEGSASASEILALALKESYGATIVGTKSFGKGTVQELEELSSGSMVKYTSAYWLSPNGNSIDKVGVTPDIEVTLVNGVDTQLNKALEIIK